MSAPTLFDSHLHLTAPRLAEDRDAVLRRARAAGVGEMVTIASDPEDALAAVALAHAEDGIWATAGLHPHEAARTGEAALAAIARLLGDPGVVAIGETGLDYHYDLAPRETQIANFRAHLDLAAETGLPIVVHARQADGDVARLIAEYRGRVTGVLHCFSSGRALLEAGLEAGWYASFSGLVTFVDDLAPLVREVPGDRLLIETDAPYLAPVPERGRRNEPAFLRHTAARVAELRGVPESDVARDTRRNARRFYGLEEVGA